MEHRDDVLKILNAIRDAGALYLGFGVRNPNLEEVFLKLTGEALLVGSIVGKEAA